MVDIDRLPAEATIQLYTEQDLARARRKGKVLGWIQGGAAVILGGLALQLLGWVPTVLALGVVGYILYRLLGGGKKDEPVGGCLLYTSPSPRDS